LAEPEKLARRQIDAQLFACGWVIQDYRQFNPSAGRGIALREAPLKSGTCDYLLLVDRKAAGVIEAKKEGTLLSGVAEQSAHYAVNLPDFIQSITTGTLPFLFWLKDDALEESANLPAPEIIAADIAADLEAALEQFATIAEDLNGATR